MHLLKTAQSRWVFTFGMFFVQVTIVLRERLEAIGVEVSVETFEEHQGTEALGEDPFVSCKMMMQVVGTCGVSCVVLHSLA